MAHKKVKKAVKRTGKAMSGATKRKIEARGPKVKPAKMSTSYGY